MIQVQVLLLGVITLLLIDIVIDLVSARMNFKALSINTLKPPNLPRMSFTHKAKVMIASAQRRPALHVTTIKTEREI